MGGGEGGGKGGVHHDDIPIVHGGGGEGTAWWYCAYTTCITFVYIRTYIIYIYICTCNACHFQQLFATDAAL